MATQIFIEPELETQHEGQERWAQLCSALHLQPQLKKIGKADNIANPYTKLDPRAERVFTLLCPRREVYSAYSGSTLPVDILEEIHRCNKNEWFQKIEVWYDDQSPDPFLVGYEGKKWDAHKFLIARWGDELLPFEQLMNKAITRFKEVYLRALNRLIMDCEFRKLDIEGEIREYINHGDGYKKFKFPSFDNPIS